MGMTDPGAGGMDEGMMDPSNMGEGMMDPGALEVIQVWKAVTMGALALEQTQVLVVVIPQLVETLAWPRTDPSLGGGDPAASGNFGAWPRNRPESWRR